MYIFYPFNDDFIDARVEKKPVIYSIPSLNLINEIPYDMKLKTPVTDLMYAIEEGKDTVRYSIDVKYHGQMLNNQEGLIYHLKNIYISGTGAISTDQYEIFIPKTGINIGPDYIYIFKPGNVVGRYHRAIFSGDGVIYSFGHFINDLLSPLMAMPEYMFLGTVIICRTNPFVKEYFRYLNITNEVVMINPDEWVFVSEVYYPGKPRPHCHHSGACYMKLGNLLRKSFGLENVVPDRYVLSNRITKARMLYNMDEALAKVKEKYPQYNWEIHNMTGDSIQDLAKIWGHARILFAVCGSNLMNAFLLPKGSVTIELICERNDYSAIDCALASPTKLIVCFDGTIPHGRKRANMLRISQLLSALDAAFHYLDHNTWPQNRKGHVVRYNNDKLFGL